MIRYFKNILLSLKNFKDNYIIKEKIFEDINSARIYRDNTIDNLESNGYTIVSVSISLVRL